MNEYSDSRMVTVCGFCHRIKSIDVAERCACSPQPATSHEALLEEQIAELLALRDAATSFRLGKLDDSDHRNYVSVHRQYDVPDHMRWAVAICGEKPMRVVSEWRDQSVALVHGTRVLNEIRRG